MHINVDTLIIGAGYSGLIFQNKLQSLGMEDSIIVERGYSNGYTDSDYVIFTKKKFPFSGRTIDVNINRMSSGAAPFMKEYSKKVYNKSIEAANVKLFSGESERIDGITIDNEYLLRDSKCYGNIDIKSINPKGHTARGRILHLNEDVTINYKRLVNTIPVHRFLKLVQIDAFKMFNLFISYFPIGIKKITTEEFREEMTIDYTSDPAVPYYRKQLYGNNIFYEYCLNKPMDVRFSAVVVPGKFVKPSEQIMDSFYDYFLQNDILFAGRFATWDADYLLDQIWEPGDSLSNKMLTSFYEDIK